MKKLLLLLASIAIACGQTMVVTQTPVQTTQLTATPAIKQTQNLVSTPAKPIEMKNLVVCNSWGLNVRTGAGATFPLVQTQPLEDGTVVAILENLYDVNGYLWYRVSFDGGAGVVYSKYLCGEK